jgi:hypothetical protein
MSVVSSAFDSKAAATSRAAESKVIDVTQVSEVVDTMDSKADCVSECDMNCSRQLSAKRDESSHNRDDTTKVMHFMYNMYLSHMSILYLNAFLHNSIDC